MEESEDERLSLLSSCQATLDLIRFDLKHPSHPDQLSLRRRLLTLTDTLSNNDHPVSMMTLVTYYLF